MKRVIRRNSVQPRSPASAVVREEHHWGDVAIHFAKGAPLLLSISETERKTLLEALGDDDMFLHVFSLSNQVVAVRRAAITELSLASEESGTYGPEHESYDMRAIWEPRGPSFWEAFHELVVQELPAQEVASRHGAETVTEIQLSIEMKGKTHTPRVSDIEPSTPDDTNALTSLASCLVWQLSNGKIREKLACGCDLTQHIWMYDRCDPPRTLISVRDDDAQRTFINAEALDYISIPKHLLRLASRAVSP